MQTRNQGLSFGSKIDGILFIIDEAISSFKKTQCYSRDPVFRGMYKGRTLQVTGMYRGQTLQVRGMYSREKTIFMMFKYRSEN